MSEEAKVRHTDEAIKIEVREKNGSVKIRKLESNNRDIVLIDSQYRRIVGLIETR